MAEPPPPEPAETPRAPRRRHTYSRLALASLICGVCGIALVHSRLPTWGLALIGILGLVLGVAAVVQVFRSLGLVSGYGSATLGIILCHLCVVAVLTRTTPPSHIEVRIQNNLSQLCKIAMAYAIDHEGRFPPADSWHEVFMAQKYLDDDSVFKDPRNPDAGRAYAMNAHLAAVRLEQAQQHPRMVAFFECAPGSPPSGGRELLSAEPPHRGGYIMGFVGGWTEWVPAEEVSRLIWDPKADRPNE
jgi:hypothetical protein